MLDWKYLALKSKSLLIARHKYDIMRCDLDSEQTLIAKLNVKDILKMIKQILQVAYISHSVF